MTSSKELTPTFRNPEKYMTATGHIVRHKTTTIKHVKLDFTVTIENEDVLDESIPHLTACKAYFPVEIDGKQMKTQ